MNNKEFVMYKKDNGDIYSMNMKFDNFFKEKNIPYMVGGGKNIMGIPVALTMLKNDNSEEFNIQYQTGGVINDNLYNKLLHMSGKKEIANKKTKKNRKKRKKKTRKLK